MRIGFLGKGGSGKTTISAAFIKYLSQKHRVLAIDADQNTNLAETLLIEVQQDLASHANEVKQFVKGTRPESNMIATTPPTNKSQFIRITPEDPFLREYATKQDNILLIQGGSYTQSHLALTCYHGILEPLEIMYHHLLDKQDQWVVADATAGLDSLGHSMYLVHDLIVYVVEPTLKSTRVCQKFLDATKDEKLCIAVVGNKIRNQEDKRFIQEHLPQANTISFFEQSEHIRKLEQGDADALGRFVKEQQDNLQAIADYAQTIQKDWDAYLKRLIKAHKRSAESWFDKYHNDNISEQYDPNFRYEDHV